MNKYIFTFGVGHELKGRCQPIYADSSQDARDEMVEVYGLNWAFQYSGDEWDGYKKDTNRMWPMETEIKPIYA